MPRASRACNTLRSRSTGSASSSAVDIVVGARGAPTTTTGSFFAFGPSSVLGPRAADDALLLRLQRTGVRSSRRGQVGGLDQQER
eukprot:scaffold30826_cov67-Phaeocystis_antarctica.AAC.1